jgi:hypothetical protein
MKRLILFLFFPILFSCSKFTENSFSLSCVGTQTEDSLIFGKSSENKTKTFHFKNKILENYNCNTWENERIVCDSLNNGDGISNMKNQSIIKIDRISGDISIETTGSIYDEKKELVSTSRIVFQGKCEKLEIKKF